MSSSPATRIEPGPGNDGCFLECASLEKTTGGALDFTMPLLVDGKPLWNAWDSDPLAILEEHYGTRKISELKTLYGGVLQAGRRMFARARLSREANRGVLDWTISEYLAAARKGTVDRYLSNVALSGLPELEKHYQPATMSGHNFLQNYETLNAREVFVGAPGSQYSELHVDGVGGAVWCLCLAGVKEWIVLPPSDSRKLRPFQATRAPQIRHSMLDPWDAATCELFDTKDLHPVRVYLRAGEALFLPPNWWHITRNRELSFTINERVFTWQSVPLIARWLLHVGVRKLTPGPPQPFVLY